MFSGYPLIPMQNFVGAASSNLPQDICRCSYLQSASQVQEHINLKFSLRNRLLVSRIIAFNREYILYSEIIQFDKSIFSLFSCKSVAKYMRNCVNIVFILIATLIPYCSLVFFRFTFFLMPVGVSSKTTSDEWI